MIMRPALCVLFALLPCHAADLFPVTGTVINAIGKSPIPHAQVYIYRTGTPRPSTPYITGTDGRFTFNLPSGSYALHAGIRGTSENYGSNNDESGLGSAVIVGPGKDTTNLIFRFFPTSSISGKVLDDAGEPVENAVVQLIRTSVVTGARVSSAFRSVRTNDLGEYRFGWIPAGTGYYVTVTAEPWYSKRNFGVNTSDQPTHAFAASYYPNTSDPSKASPLKIAPGDEVHADFTLRTVIGAKILVKHGAPVGSKGLVSLMYKGVAGVDAFQQQENLQTLRDRQTLRDIPQTLTGVPPGNYTLRVTATSGTTDLIGFQHVDVNGTDVTVDVSLHPAASVSGKLLFKDPASKPPSTFVLSLARDGGTYTASVRPDGSFRFPNVLPGKYRAAIRTPAAYFITDTSAIDVADGESVSVSLTASDEAGSLSGYVKKESKQIGGVLAVLAPITGPRYRAFQTESDGSFDILNIPAGKYLLFAIEDTLFEYTNPEAVKPYLAGATPVIIEPHKAATQDIVLSVSQ